jgi:hypothetical protein
MTTGSGRALIGVALTLACGRSTEDDARTTLDQSGKSVECTRWIGADPCRRRKASKPPSVLHAITGDDDRIDLYCLDHPDSGVPEREEIRRAAHASMAIFAHEDLILEAGVYTINPKYKPLAQAHDVDGPPLCPDEMFAQQPRGASCSGVVIAGPKLLSARHCLAGKVEPYFVRGFAMQDAGHPSPFEFTLHDVCRPLPGAKLWCFGQLCTVDISCEGPPPTIAKVSNVGLDVNDPVYTIGYPERLPAKFSGWSAINYVGGDTFTAPLDANPCNSGSPVFNADHEVIGIINADQDRSSFCRGASRCLRWKCGAGSAIAIPVTSETIEKKETP